MAEDDIKKETKEKIQHLQLMEQSLQASLAQKQSFQIQKAEIDSAIEELKDKKTAYKIIGNVLVESDAEILRKDLEKKQELISIRLKSMDRQEEKIRVKMKSLQEEILKGMKK